MIFALGMFMTFCFGWGVALLYAQRKFESKNIGRLVIYGDPLDPDATVVELYGKKIASLNSGDYIYLKYQTRTIDNPSNGN